MSGATRRLLPCGPTAWLVELPEHEPAAAVGLAAAIGRRGDPGVVDVVPGARTVLVTFTDRARRAAAAGWLGELDVEASPVDERSPAVELPVRYDGEDLDPVAAACGLSTHEVVERHAAATYVCAFCGFAPGFGYLLGLDPALHLPRRPAPRTRVPAGSVAIAAGYSAVYPSASPGGWHLLGHTDARLWDVGRSPPALITPGTTVRFVPT